MSQHNFNEKYNVLENNISGVSFFRPIAYAVGWQACVADGTTETGASEGDGGHVV